MAWVSCSKLYTSFMRAIILQYNRTTHWQYGIFHEKNLQNQTYGDYAASLSSCPQSRVLWRGRADSGNAGCSGKRPIRDVVLFY